MLIKARIIFPSLDGVGGFASERTITSPAELMAELENLCTYNLAFLAINPRLPDIYKAGVRYKAEPPGEENWLTYPILIGLKVGDCEDLACARVAKLRQKGDSGAKPHLYHKKRLWHVMVRHGDGTIEDPSARLGMYDK